MPNRGRALCTGAGGLIGSHVVDCLLANDYEVIAIDANPTNLNANLKPHPRLKTYCHDITHTFINNGPWLFDGVDDVFHFAGMMDLVPSIANPALYMNTNVMGTVNVLEAARRVGVKKFVYAASSSCYGDNPPLPTNELAPIENCHPYALSKWMGEQACMHWHRAYKLPVNSLRIFNAYGPRLRGSHGAYGAVFGVFMKQKLEGAPFTVVGDGEQGRDFVFAADLAEAFVMAAETPMVGQIWNVGGGHPRSVNEIIECLGGGEIVHLPKRPGEPETTWADISKIKRDLGWYPKTSFADGVAKTVEDIASFGRMPLWTPEKIAGATKEWFGALG